MAVDLKLVAPKPLLVEVVPLRPAVTPLQGDTGYVRPEPVAPDLYDGVPPPSVTVPLSTAASTGTRTREQALEEAEKLLNGQSGGPGSLRQRLDPDAPADPPDANDPRDVPGDDANVKSSRADEAQAQVDANAELEKAALAELTPEQAAQYEAVREQLVAAGDPVAVLALQKMLFAGELPGASSLGGSPPQNLLSQLATVADPATPLAEGIDRGQLLCDLVQEVATPSCIDQQNKSTCTVTAASIMLARQNPAEYVRLVAGLASPSGQVTMADGKTVLTRESGTELADDSGRTISQRLLEPALMELGNGTYDYDNAQNGSYLGKFRAYAGLNPEGLEIVLEAMFGKSFTAEHYDYPPTAEDAQKLMDSLLEQVSIYGDTMTGIQVGTDEDGNPILHEVLVTGTETLDGVEYVTYIDPYGREARMTVEEFTNAIVSVEARPIHRSPPNQHEYQWI